MCEGTDALSKLLNSFQGEVRRAGREIRTHGFLPGGGEEGWEGDTPGREIHTRGFLSGGGGKEIEENEL